MTLFMALFTQFAQAQTQNVFMKDGTTTIQRGSQTINFYDSHGASVAYNYWEKWYGHRENFTYVFKPAVPGDKIKVTFKPYTAYSDPTPENTTEYEQMQADPNNYTGVSIGQWTLRLNDDELAIYQGNGAVDDNEITTLSGNSQFAGPNSQGFTVMSDGAITFKFTSNDRYREEGWYAQVELVQGDMVAQAPFIQRATCSDQVEIFPTTLGAKIIYSIGDNDPEPADPLAPPTYEYTGPISFPEGEIPSTGFKVNARSQLAEGGGWSAVSHITFQESDRVPMPDADDNLAHTKIERVDGTNTIVMTPAGKRKDLNETYEVHYTVGTTSNPPANPTYQSPVYQGPITCTESGTVYKARTFAKSCSNQMSPVEYIVTLTVNGIYAPDPVIDFNAMTITSTEGEATFDILYTVNGTDPAISGTTITGTFSNGTVNLSSLNPALTYGQTVKALAYKASGDNGTPDPNYTASHVVTAIYVPTDENGNTQNGVYGGIVLLDDREDHTWAYYSNENSPIKSLNPADVKITYTGYGSNTMTTDNTDPKPGRSDFNADVQSNQVAVNKGEAGNQFIYLKTLEKDGDNYPYTMIANPFQVRPTYDSKGNAKGTEGSKADNTLLTENFDGMSSISTTYSASGWYAYKATNANNWTLSDANPHSGSYSACYVYSSSQAADCYLVSPPFNVSTDMTNLSVSLYERVSSSSYTEKFEVFFVKASDVTYASQVASATKYSAIASASYTNTTYAQKTGSSSNSALTGQSVRVVVRCTSARDQARLFIDDITVTETTPDSGGSGEYRGFYAWRVKTMSSGLSIKAGGTTYTSANINTGNGIILYSDQDIEFITTAEDGNEVEFEALWANMYYNSNSHYDNDGDYKNAYERNYKKVNSLTTYNYPVTISSINPDGSGTVSSVSCSSDYSCSNDVKLENMTLSMANYYLDGNNHSLHIGRGVANGNSNVASAVYGYYDPAENTNSFVLRVESGRYGVLYGLRSESAKTITSDFTENIILGSDYDRAKKDNGKLKVSSEVQMGSYIFPNSENSKINVYALSGQFGSNDEDVELYMGLADGNSDNNKRAKRYLEVLGGEYFGGIAGGLEKGVATDTHVLTIRIKGGTIHQYVYGAAQWSTAYGTRKIIITGGSFDSWIAGGCYGTGNTSSRTGVTDGNTYVYFGGKASQTNTDGVFGAGYGSYAFQTGFYTVVKSYVVVADDATTSGSVYGGGNNGYNTSDAEVWVLGGGKNGLTVSGSVFGGANKAPSQATTTVTMEKGTVNGSVYGGANTSGAVAQLATVKMSGGTVKGSVYGGGKGSGTTMSNNTMVTVTGGTINANMYGGGEEGKVSGNATVSFEGGSVTDIYGAGQGASSDVALGTTVNVKGGVVNGAVYGGGENGTVAYNASGNSSSYGSTVNISGGEVKGDVFGGGKMGTTQGATTVNISGALDKTILRENVFAGAYGSHDLIYVAGLKTLNISGGRIYGSVYGGSRNANDGQTLNSTTGDATTSVVNISGGRIDQNVYAAGYYGETFGSVYAFIGINAINGAPNSLYDDNYPYEKNTLLIGGSIWAGGDWGVFSGSFGAPTVSGNSNIYINGEGYSTDGNDQSAANYMNIEGSILGSGTSCDAGKGERTLILSNYGYDIANNGSDIDVNPYAYASRQVNSIQRFHNVIFDNAKLGFIGQGKVNSLNTTEKYALYEIDENVYLANGSTMVMNVSSSQIYSFHSVTCPNTYADTPVFTKVAYNGLGATGGETDNKIRVNGGSFVEIKYVPESNSSSGGDEPSGEGETLTFDFEDGTLGGWTAIDNDGDGYNWAQSSDEDVVTHSGTGAAVSASYVNYVGALNPDNWLISPQVTLGGTMTFWAAGQDPDWADEVFGVFVSTSGTAVNNFVQVGTDYTATSTMTQYSVDLSSYSGNGYLAIRHYNVTNMFYLNVDDITITQPGSGSSDDPEEPEEPEAAKPYGELEGFAHMMAGNPDSDATCAYARPKQSKESGNILPQSASDYFNTEDGGFVSYRSKDNQYDIEGNFFNGGEKDQLRYENHYPGLSKGNNSEYYRIWRHGGDHQTVPVVITAVADGHEGEFKAVEVEFQLPSWGKPGSYYRFDRTGTQGDYNTYIDYGEHVMTFNGANYADEIDGNTWMYWQDDENTPQVTGVGQSNTTVASALANINNNPNLNFGLVLIPGETMKETDASYIINNDADSYLASLEKPFNCDDNTHMPTMKLRLTYSDELSANATLDPVKILLVQCDSNGNITDYVTIEVTIITKASITSGFRTQVYARMDGSTNIRETATATVVLPSFNVAESGEESFFYLKSVRFLQGTDPAGVALLGGNSVIYAKKSDNTNLSADRFAMTIEAQANPDNVDDWNFNQGPQDGVDPSKTNLTWGQDNDRGVWLGQAKGRNPLSFGVTLFYNSNVEVDAKTKMGEVEFTIEFTNYEGGDPDNDYKSEFTVTVEVWRVGPGRNFYVDGQNGVDEVDAQEKRGHFPDMPAKTVNYIFNRMGYLPGDNIFVVNQLPISKTTTWDGSKFSNNVNIYRYPGGHKMSTGDISTTEMPNGPYLGTLVDVTRELTIKGVKMDGLYAEATAPVSGTHNTSLYPTEASGLGNCTFDGAANAPLIAVSNGARVNLTNGTKLLNNYNNTTAVISGGGAVHVAYGGILAMNEDTRMEGNINAKGGAIYMDGSMIVADHVYIFDNYEAPAAKEGEPVQNNVMLAPVAEEEGSFRVVQLGTSANDAYGPLLQTEGEDETKIGVNKNDWGHGYDGYMPVVYAEAGTLDYLDDPYDTQSMIVHDGDIYKLERYVSDEYSDSPNYLYWMGTWVTAVTSKPEGFEADNIDTPEELAWAISIVNGENKQTANPNANFKLTGDVDMTEHIWVPIGNESALYKGTFEGNGHVVTGINGTITRTDMGMFGRTEGATIQNMVVETEFTSNAENMGTLVGNMNGGTLSNVEGAGNNTNKYSSGTNGGLVGVNGGTIHSAFSVATIKGGANMGGLVGINNSDLINAYSAADLSDGSAMAGLVSTNNGRVENCYDATNANVAFASKNNGTIKYCYTAEVGEDETITYVKLSGDNAVLENHGTYGEVLDRKALGYMYGDNKVTAEGNGYVKTTHEYLNNHTVVWDGLLSVLNQWVADGTIQNKPTGLSTWNRPLTQDLNGDLPILAFPKDNCLGNYAEEDGKMLRYSAYNLNPDTDAGETFNNGLDNLLTKYSGKVANVYLYNSATGVVSGTGSNNLFIHEDAALLQAEAATGDKAMETIKAVVGVTFDNSCKKADDYFGNTLEYDWHLMSTPLSDAQLGITYADFTDHNYWPSESDKGQALTVANSYMPNMTRANVNADWPANWDFYTYYEPYYHWINFKRNINSHHHFDDPHDQIPYQGFEQTTSNDEPGYLIKGRGYMMAISQDSYLSNTGKLNNGDVPMPLTVSGTLPETELPSKDWGSNLVGNPYQAYLDLSKVPAKTGFYIYDADINAYGPYMTGASVNPVLPSEFIHPHQGFFVVTTEADPDFKFTYNMATATSNKTSFFRGNEQPAYPVVNLFVDNERGNRDLAIIELNRPELDGVRKVNNLRNANFKLYAHYDGGNYGLLFTPEDAERVPVHFRTMEDGTFTMTWSTYNGTFTNLILVDNLTGTRTNMLTTDHYTFEGSVDDYAARFYITFNVTDVNELNGENDDFTWFDGNDWIVTGKGQLDVIDVTGRVLRTERVSGEQTRLHLDGVAAGVDVMRLSEGNRAMTQKIVVK